MSAKTRNSSQNCRIQSTCLWQRDTSVLGLKLYHLSTGYEHFPYELIPFFGCKFYSCYCPLVELYILDLLSILSSLFLLPPPSLLRKPKSFRPRRQSSRRKFHLSVTGRFKTKRYAVFISWEGGYCLEPVSSETKFFDFLEVIERTVLFIGHSLHHAVNILKRVCISQDPTGEASEGRGCSKTYVFYVCKYTSSWLSSAFVHMT